MKTITLPSLAREADAVFAALNAGESFVVKHRGKPAGRLSAIKRKARPAKTDPFYSLGKLTFKGGGSLSNEEMDRVIYGA
jgi:antitoxin (DNA-binding transcriptional repressor) of toxin-antitoxin stability system